MKENCENCKFWEHNNGIWCFNGWSGSGRKDGKCHLEQKSIYKHGEDFCSKYYKEVK